jgi:hypothetical protein
LNLFAQNVLVNSTHPGTKAPCIYCGKDTVVLAGPAGVEMNQKKR